MREREKKIMKVYRKLAALAARPVSQRRAEEHARLMRRLRFLQQAEANEFRRRQGP